MKFLFKFAFLDAATPCLPEKQDSAFLTAFFLNPGYTLALVSLVLVLLVLAKKSQTTVYTVFNLVLVGYSLMLYAVRLNLLPDLWTLLGLRLDYPENLILKFRINV